jgi:hypothetical protein
VHDQDRPSVTLFCHRNPEAVGGDHFHRAGTHAASLWQRADAAGRGTRLRLANLTLHTGAHNTGINARVFVGVLCFNSHVLRKYDQNV